MLKILNQHPAYSRLIKLAYMHFKVVAALLTTVEAGKQGLLQSFSLSVCQQVLQQYLVDFLRLLSLHKIQSTLALITVKHLLRVSYIVFISKKLLKETQVFLLHGLSNQTVVAEHATLIESRVMLFNNNFLIRSETLLDSLFLFRNSSNCLILNSFSLCDFLFLISFDLLSIIYHFLN